MGPHENFKPQTHIIDMKFKHHQAASPSEMKITHTSLHRHKFPHSDHSHVSSIGHAGLARQAKLQDSASFASPSDGSKANAAIDASAIRSCHPNSSISFSSTVTGPHSFQRHKLCNFTVGMFTECTCLDCPFQCFQKKQRTCATNCTWSAAPAPRAR